MKKRTKTPRRQTPAEKSARRNQLVVDILGWFQTLERDLGVMAATIRHDGRAGRKLLTDEERYWTEFKINAIAGHVRSFWPDFPAVTTLAMAERHHPCYAPAPTAGKAGAT